jgi:uncharacterized protein YukE
MCCQSKTFFRSCRCRSLLLSSHHNILPFLTAFSFLQRPDFAHIDEFKSEICDALSSYSSKIEHYLKEMQECDQTCDALREELSRLRTVGTYVRTNARCAFTNKLVLEENEPFYAFPSGYVVLEGALKREIMPFLNTKQKARVESIEKELSQLRKNKGTHNDCMLEDLQSELDGLIAAECPLSEFESICFLRTAPFLTPLLSIVNK